MLLKRRGYEVQTAKTAAEAISAVKDSIAHDALVDLVISDLGLPDESGLDLLPKLRKICNVPAIALSGYGSDEDIHRSHDAGFQEHITKPFNLEKLLEAIARLLGQQISMRKSNHHFQKY
jgi:DNA-binding response OmpR family regulator